MPENLPIWVTPAVAIVLGAITWLTARTWKPGARELEFAAAVNARLTVVESTVVALELKVEHLEEERGKLREYAWLVRGDYFEATGLDPRPWPPGLP